MQRDLYIDFAKGLATISVIFIHTVFWSGQFYVPSEVRAFSLLFDVVLFYALSGITSGSHVEKTFYRLLKLQITYMIFVTVIFLLDYFFKVFGLSVFGMQWMKDFYSVFGGKYVPQSISTYPQWQNLANWFVHSYSNADTFPVIMGSFWYLKVYFILTVFAVLILRFFPKHVWWFIGLCFGLTLIFNLFPQYFPTGQVAYVALYLGVFLLGNRLKGKQMKAGLIMGCFALAFAALFWVFYEYGSEMLYKFNKNKFPPKLPYIIWITPGVLMLFALYNRVKISKKNWITNIGSNAIFFYFAQGISSTLIYFLVVPLKDSMHWILLLMMAFGANLVLVHLIAFAVQWIDDQGWRVLKFLQKNTGES